MRTFDDILNKYTMYRVLLYGLGGLLAIALILSLTGAITISASGLVLSAAILTVSCYLGNVLFSRLLRIPRNTESWLITALILTCILPPVTSVERAFYIALAGLIAMASKFIIVYRGSNIFNPAAFGAFVVSIAGLLPATWWVASPWMTSFTALLALIVLRKQRKFTMFSIFAVSSVVMLLLVGMLQGQEPHSILWSAVVSWPIIFFGSIMLTEPSTLPQGNQYKALLAVIVGLLFASQLHTDLISTTPQTVLLVGNVLVALAAPTYATMLRLVELRQLSPDIIEAIFTKPRNLSYEPGQYMEFTLPHRNVDDRGNRRTFSIASAPNEPNVRIAFRCYPKGSSFKRAFTGLQPGAHIRAAHPDGEFTLPPGDAPLLFVAGGIGITPFSSIIAALDKPRDIVLLYFGRTPEDFVFREEFERARALGVQTHYLTDPLDAAGLGQLVPDVAHRVAYISGPPGMVRGYKQTLHVLGVPYIKTDRFSGY